jgi:hypothetical protein
MARAIHAAGSVVLSISDPDDRAQAVSYLTSRVGRDEALIQGCLEDRTQRPGRRRGRESGRSLA